MYNVCYTSVWHWCVPYGLLNAGVNNCFGVKAQQMQESADACDATPIFLANAPFFPNPLIDSLTQSVSFHCQLVLLLSCWPIRSPFPKSPFHDNNETGRETGANATNHLSYSIDSYHDIIIHAEFSEAQKVGRIRRRRSLFQWARLYRHRHWKKKLCVLRKSRRKEGGNI